MDTHTSCTHKCTHCDFQASNIINLWKHKHRLHPRKIVIKKYLGRQFMCVICGKEYNNRLLLIKHRRQVHGKKTLEDLCEGCGTLEKIDLKSASCLRCSVVNVNINIKWSTNIQLSRN